MTMRLFGVGTVLAVGMALAAASASAQVMPDVLGTEKSAKKWMTKTKNFVKNNDIDALIKKLGNKNSKFKQAKHHIAVLRINDKGRIFVSRHSAYGSLSGVDMTQQQDLKGRYYIKSFAKDAKSGGGTTKLRLQIPETGKVKTSWCINEWAPGYKGKYFLTVCY